MEDIMNIKEGELCKVVEIEGVRFEIFYGYDCESERRPGWEPTPQYPNFKEQPQYSKDGYMFTLAYSDPCEHYDMISEDSFDHWCANCKLFDKREECIGLCKCPHNRVRKNE